MFIYLDKKLRCPRKLKKRLKKRYGLNYLYYFLGIAVPTYSLGELCVAPKIQEICERLYNFGPTFDI